LYLQNYCCFDFFDLFPYIKTMFIRILKILSIFLIFLYYSSAFSKSTESNNFNHRYLSNYFSALVSYENGDNELAIKYFDSTKNILRDYPNYFERYVNSLVLNSKVSEAINQIKFFKSKNNIKNYQTTLLFTIDAFKNNNFNKANDYLMDMKRIMKISTYEEIIYEILNSYNQLFLKRKISEVENYGKLSQIVLAFQYCYLDDDRSDSNFANLINLDSGDYSRYLFFYLSNLIYKNDYSTAKLASLKIEPITSSLLILQSKSWIDKSNFDNFSNIFSCKSENDVLAEIFFLISNLYSSQEEYNMSNFYLNISNYLNPKFKFNLSLAAENYYLMNKDTEVKKILKKFSIKDDIYYWYRIKKEFEILKEAEGKEKSLTFLNLKVKNLKFKSPKIYFDLGNIYKGFKEYNKSIENYNFALNEISKKSDSYADILYRRGGSYERIKDYKKADEDLLLSLELSPDQPYVLNYLAYSWLERKIKIKQSMKMLLKAYQQTQNDPYIIDSVGWAYYLTEDYILAEKYLKSALLIMPDDPIVNDHYGDVLWKLNMKLQASYYWNAALLSDEAENKLKKKINKKLLFGLKDS
tara:strand:- start:45 stop:1790 length:1746 start_codon:yes stop_codon:yes gene_type:complete